MVDVHLFTDIMFHTFNEVEIISLKQYHVFLSYLNMTTNLQRKMPTNLGLGSKVGF